MYVCVRVAFACVLCVCVACVSLGRVCMRVRLWAHMLVLVNVCACCKYEYVYFVGRVCVTVCPCSKLCVNVNAPFVRRPCVHVYI